MSNVIFEQVQAVGCPSCKTVFNFEVQFTEEDMKKELWVDTSCNNCSAELTLDFEPYLAAETTIYKSLTSSKGRGLVLNIPDKIRAKIRENIL